MLNCIAAKLNWFTAFCNFINIVRDQKFNFIMSGNCIDHIPYQNKNKNIFTSMTGKSKVQNHILKLNTAHLTISYKINMYADQ